MEKHIALLKLEAAREIVDFINPIEFKEGKNITKYSWDQVQWSIATMKEKYICIKKGISKDEIFFIGEWSPESSPIGNRIFEYHKGSY